MGLNVKRMFLGEGLFMVVRAGLLGLLGLVGLLVVLVGFSIVLVGFSRN